MDRSKQGFTIIELVVVILILGILAAVAFPKFVDLQDDAHTAKNQGTGGALAAAVNIVHAAWLAGGDSTVTQITLEDGTVVGLGPEGWPENDNVVAPDGTMNVSDCETMWTSVLQAGAPTVGAGADYVATVADPTCTYTYQADSVPARTITYNSATGAVVTSP